MYIKIFYYNRRYNHYIVIFKIMYIVLLKKLSYMVIMHVLAYTLRIKNVRNFTLYRIQKYITFIFRTVSLKIYIKLKFI